MPGTISDFKKTMLEMFLDCRQQAQVTNVFCILYFFFFFIFWWFEMMTGVNRCAIICCKTGEKVLKWNCLYFLPHSHNII